MEWVVDDFSKGGGRGDVVSDSTDGDEWSVSFGILPFAKDANKDVGWCMVVQELGYKYKLDGKARCVPRVFCGWRRG